jgi:uncharacterized protein (DUF2384 family)
MIEGLAVKPDAPQAFDTGEKLSRLVKSFGQNATAELVDLEYVLDRALRIFYPDEAGPWLTQPEPLLGGAIPLNVLVLRGAAPVVAALTRIGAGAFA